MQKIFLILSAFLLPEIGSASSEVMDFGSGYDARKAPLNVDVVKEWETSKGQFQLVRYDLGKLKGSNKSASPKIAAYYGYPKGAKKVPGIVQIHGGGQRASLSLVKQWVDLGYACATFQQEAEIKLPPAAFDNITVKGVVDYLRFRTRELNPMGTRNFVLLGERKSSHTQRFAKITLKGGSLASTLDQLCEQTAFQYKITKHAIELYPKTYQRPIVTARDDQQAASQKLDQLSLQRFDAANSSLSELATYLQQQSKQIDAKQTGIQFRIAPKLKEPDTKHTHSIQLRNVPIRVILGYICEQIQCRYAVEGGTVYFLSANEP